MDCIFCNIIKGHVPSHKVYEDDNSFAFLDIAPVSKGHVLVIPKKHYVNLEDIPEEELALLIKAVKNTGKILKEKINVKGYNVQENNDPVAGQIVPHIHFHIIPRSDDDGLKLWPQEGYDEGEAEEIIKQLKITN